jgi:uncharacterized protein
LKLLRATLILLFLVVAAVLVTGIWYHDTYQPRLREVTVQVAGLPREVTLLQVSDLHGRLFGDGQSRLADLLAGHPIDAAVLTGDMLDYPTQPRGGSYALVRMLRQHTPRVYYLRGNHDPVDLRADLITKGATGLETDRPVAFSPADPSGRSIALAYGVDSASIGRANGWGRQLLVMASHTPPNPTRLAAAKKLGGSGEHLFIAGHTHGGQIRLPLIGALWAPTSWYAEEGGHPEDNGVTFLPDLRGYLIDGMYVRDGQDVFVSNGVGTTSLGIKGHSLNGRFLCRSEIVLFHFVPKR